MRTLDKITIENYGVIEDSEVNVNGTIVSFTCESCNGTYWNGEDYEDENGYPYKYIVTVEKDGKSVEGYAFQKNEFESAFHHGFEVAYRYACRRLGIEPSLV